MRIEFTEQDLEEIVIEVANHLRAVATRKIRDLEEKTLLAALRDFVEMPPIEKLIGYLRLTKNGVQTYADHVVVSVTSEYLRRGLLIPLRSMKLLRDGLVRDQVIRVTGCSHQRITIHYTRPEEV